MIVISYDKKPYSTNFTKYAIYFLTELGGTLFAIVKSPKHALIFLAALLIIGLATLLMYFIENMLNEKNYAEDQLNKLEADQNKQTTENVKLKAELETKEKFLNGEVNFKNEEINSLKDQLSQVRGEFSNVSAQLKYRTNADQSLATKANTASVNEKDASHEENSIKTNKHVLYNLGGN